MVSGKKSRRPEVVRRGSVVVKIYTVCNRTHGRSYAQYALAYRRPDGIRVVRRFSNHVDARREAELAATALVSGDADSNRLGGSERNEYLRSADLLKPFGLSVFGAVEDYTKVKSKLPAGVSLVSILDFYLAKHACQFSNISVREAVERMVAAKRKSSRSAVYIEDLELRLGRFASVFHQPMSEVGGSKVEWFLDHLSQPGKPVSPRTSQNYLRVIKSLYRFAAKHRLIPNELVEDLSAIEIPEAGIGAIEVFNPSELRILLACAARKRPELVSHLAVGAFAGLRAAEIQRLDWKQIDFESGYLEVTAENAKIRGRRRLVPMSENLRLWLAPRAATEGPISPFAKVGNDLIALAERASMTWKHNGLRHSFISYRCALTKNVAQVSYEAGNSPSMIHTHYLNMRTEKEAREWFGILPD